jgi:superfamily II DNA or RNA helicase
VSDRSRHIPEAVRRRVEYFAGQDCVECGRTIDGERLLRHLDHREAFAEGGEHVAFNLDPLCHACNQAKGDGTTARTERLARLREERDAEIQAYFQEADVNIVGNDQLREPQAEGYLALRDYFDAADERATNLPAIAVLPTGCGKSGLIACAPFGIAEGRVLVVTPNLTIKEGLADGTLAGADTFYQLCDILPPGTPPPRIVALDRGRVNEEDCLRADIVVTNVQQMQGWLPLFPRDFFDCIIVDEAHHAPADSWQNINEAFPDAKKIYLTATPFRGDDKTIRAEPVYSYRLADAIAAGYVKNLMRVDAVAKEMTFTVEGKEQTFTREEIMDLRAETWFSRGVALSDVCNATIVDRSVGILQEKRRRGTEDHQIIAAACSIRHAEQVAALYRSRGLEATYVASRGMTMEEREARIRDYDAGRYDAMVHVGILGEGYDNPTISIAAIFRPFRSTAPYTQFVGRAIRALPGGTETDNIAHVVTHAGLNQEARWDYFKEEIEEAEILADIDVWEGGSEANAGDGDKKEDASSQRQAPSDPPEVTDETIDHFDVDTYLPVEGADAEETEERLAQLEEIMDDLKAKGLDVPDAEALRRQIIAMNQPVGAGDTPSPATRPDLERSAYRRILNNEVKRAAGTLIHRLGIPDGDDLVGTVGKGEEVSNFEVVVRMVHRAVNREVGRTGGPDGRNDWLLDELKDAKRAVPAARDAVQERLEASTRYAPDENGAPADAPDDSAPTRPGTEQDGANVRGRSSTSSQDDGRSATGGGSGEEAAEAASEDWDDPDAIDWGDPFEA